SRLRLPPLRNDGYVARRSPVLSLRLHWHRARSLRSPTRGDDRIHPDDKKRRRTLKPDLNRRPIDDLQVRLQPHSATDGGPMIRSTMQRVTLSSNTFL